MAVSVDASQLEQIAALPNVISVNPIRTYQTDVAQPGAAAQADPVESGSLAQAIEYIQAAPLHAEGFDGTGVKVAVLDSGIDFTHFNLGGPGDQARHRRVLRRRCDCRDRRLRDAVRRRGPQGQGRIRLRRRDLAQRRAPRRPEPRRRGVEAGHGTHVADIIGGRSADGTHIGIAPGTSLYAVKVCSSVSTSCNGVAMLLGLDWSLDPNGDGDISDAVDIVNMSLGSSYGQEQDDSALAADNLVKRRRRRRRLGRQLGRPSLHRRLAVLGPGVISVAQTSLPDDLQWVIEPSSGPAITNAVLQSWSPAPTTALSADLARPTDAGGIGCSQAAYSAFPAGFDRARLRAARATSPTRRSSPRRPEPSQSIIYNNAPGDPPSFSFGSAVPVTVPTFSISQSAGQALVAALATGPVSVTIDPANAIGLREHHGRHVQPRHDRGSTTAPSPTSEPRVRGCRQRPAPATEETNFGGTSGAAPVVAGAAALLIDKFPDATPLTIKARLLNGADNTNRTPTADGFIPTPISRIGAGEVRVAPAAAATSVLSTTGGGGNVGLGIPSVTTSNYKADVELTLTNTSDAKQKYALDAIYREEADQASGAVSIAFAPNSIVLPAGKTQKIKVQVTIDGSKLQDWPFNDVGATGGDGSLLNGPEFDGWITATSDSENREGRAGRCFPKKAADVSASSSLKLKKDGSGTLKLKNASNVAAGDVDIFALTGTSPELPDPAPGEPGSPGQQRGDHRPRSGRCARARAGHHPVRHRHVRPAYGAELPGGVRRLHRLEQRRHR